MQMGWQENQECVDGHVGVNKLWENEWGKRADGINLRASIGPRDILWQNEIRKVWLTS